MSIHNFFYVAKFFNQIIVIRKNFFQALIRIAAHKFHDGCKELFNCLIKVKKEKKNRNKRNQKSIFQRFIAFLEMSSFMQVVTTTLLKMKLFSYFIMSQLF